MQLADDVILMSQTVLGPQTLLNSLQQDDVILMSQTVVGLQTLLNSLQQDDVILMSQTVVGPQTLLNSLLQNDVILMSQTVVGLQTLLNSLQQDDVILMSQTVVGLQTLLNSLQQAASGFELKVNMNKRNIIVFQKVGYIGGYNYDGVVMPAVNKYEYFAIYFTTRLYFVSACRDLASRAKKALVCILQKLHLLNSNSLETNLKLFDAQVQPVAQYGSELWGLDKAAIDIEKVHLYALKRFLGVDMKTQSDLVYGIKTGFQLR